ncbi:MAG TPA: copper amine oxidase N-terminal domain-containing protein [Symbiobacteriaceae bacterium]|jgi:hypothetical protein
MMRHKSAVIALCLLLSAVLMPAESFAAGSKGAVPGVGTQQLPSEGGSDRICEGRRNPAVSETGDPLGTDFAVIIRGQCYQFDAPVVVKNGRTLMPMRELVTATVPSGYINNVVHLKWFQEYGTACLDASSNVLCYPNDQNYMIWNGMKIQLDQGAVVLDGRTRVPFRDLIEKNGGTVRWDGDSHTIWIEHLETAYNIWMTPEQVCNLMGYSFDTCPADGVIAGHYTYQTWGTDFIIENLLNGTLFQPGMRQYVNKFGLERKGDPLETQFKWGYAIANTAIDVATAIYIGSLVKNVAPATVREVTTPVGREVLLDGSAAAGKHDVWFWANRNSFSPRVVAYQLRNAPGSGSTVENGALEMWEYAWKGIAFDGMDREGALRIFVETKSDGGYFTRLSSSSVGEFFLGKMDRDLGDEITQQFLALRGEHNVVLEWRVETQDLYNAIWRAVDGRVFLNLREALGEQEGTAAFQELVQMIRVKIVP